MSNKPITMDINFRGLFGRVNASNFLIREEAQKAIAAIGVKFQGDAVKLIHGGTRTGKTYGNHRASAAGEPPKTDTGNLAKNIIPEYSPDRLSVTVGARQAASYGKGLELGTSTVAARPWLRPTLNNNKPYIERRMKRAISAAVKRSASDV